MVWRGVSFVGGASKACFICGAVSMAVNLRGVYVCSIYQFLCWWLATVPRVVLKSSFSCILVLMCVQEGMRAKCNSGRTWCRREHEPATPSTGGVVIRRWSMRGGRL